MMLKEKSSPWARVKYLYVLPIAAITLTAFARPEITNELNEISAIKVNDITSILDTKETNKSLLKIDSTKKSVSTKINIKKENDSLFFITETIYPKSDTTNRVFFTFPEIVIVDGIEVPMDSLQTIDSTRIETVTILEDEHVKSRYGDRAKNGVLSITLTTGKAPTQKSISYKLSDGTTVLLNPNKRAMNASYKIVEKDTSNPRTVKLEGEAYFKVVSRDSLVEYQAIGDTIVVTRNTSRYKIVEKK